MGKEIISLYELQTRLKEGVERIFPSKLWLKAEVSAVKARPGGHCYLELSQSGESGLVAKAQAVIWAAKYRFLAPFFESVTGSPLSEGMLVLVRVQVNFSQLYGLSLVIDDIDPDFSLGEKEKEDILRPIITDFASVFSIPAEHCIEGSFIAIEADKSKSYSQLYAAV